VRVLDISISRYPKSRYPKLRDGVRSTLRSCHWIIAVDLPCLPVFHQLNKHTLALRAPLHYLFWSSRSCSGARLAHYTCTPAIIVVVLACTLAIVVVVLAINDKHTLPVKHANGEVCNSNNTFCLSWEFLHKYK
jgi:hypothetical protein